MNEHYTYTALLTSHTVHVSRCSTGYGWAIAKACAEAGAKILLGTWPPVMPIFQVHPPPTH